MIEVLATIGEVCCIGIGLVFIFSLFAFLFSNKGFPVKALIPVFGGVTGACIGAYLGLFISETMASLGAVVFGIAGLVISISAIN